MTPEETSITEQQADIEADAARLEVELEASRPKDDAESVDLTVPPSLQLGILRQMRNGALAEYYQYKTTARLNRLIDNETDAKAFDKKALGNIKILAQMDKEIKELEILVMTLPVE